jgi:hypothetical protein
MISFFINCLLSIAGYFVSSLGWGTIAMMAVGAVLAMVCVSKVLSKVKKFWPHLMAAASAIILIWYCSPSPPPPKPTLWRLPTITMPALPELPKVDFNIPEWWNKRRQVPEVSTE